MKQKLELTWAGKDEPLKVEPRILLYDREKSHGAQDTGNLLIHGDNLLALKALEKKYAGQVKCIYIDPPYNARATNEYYDDNFEHSMWLSLMKSRIEILRALLREDGFIFIQIDNYEMAYLKVLLDEIFGRNCFVNDIVWKRKGGSVNPRNKLNNNTDYILWYAKTADADIFPVYTKDDPETADYIKKRFKYTDEDGRVYRLSPIISPTYSPT
ncbi:MAG: site-specific DNA-methyltransferase, partial [Schwartzia sp.]|nr:site-specific DNA-methyltransferase [Schwartzia sp. (in: firmicutes)]